MYYIQPKKVDCLWLDYHLLLKKQRREFLEIIPPVDPGMAAGGFFLDHVERMSLEHARGFLGRFQQKIFLAASEPNQSRAGFEVGLIEGGLVVIFPRSAGGGAAETT